MNKRQYNFLEKKLTELNHNEIISEEQCANAKNYFVKQTKADKSLITIFMSLGFLLVSLGIITLFAINWEHIAKGMKVLISFLPLVITAIMQFFTMKKDDDKLKIYTSIVAPISILATNSLLSQVFHIQTEIYELFFTSLLMFMPIAFILRNYLSILVYSVGTVVYAISATGSISFALVTTGLISLPIFVYEVINYKNNKRDRKNTLMWTAIVCILTLFFIRTEFLSGHAIIIYFYMIYLMTRKLFNEESLLNKLFKLVFVSIVLIACISSDMVLYVEKMTFTIDAIIFTFLSAIFIAFTKVYKEPKEWFIFVYVCLIQYLGILENEILYILISILALILGCYKIAIGNKNCEYKESKQGLAIVLYLIFIRFMNADLTFAMKSIIFLLSGVAFMFVANMMKKRIGGNEDEEK